MNRCLYCYGDMKQEGDFHEKCSLAFLGCHTAPVLAYTLDQMAKLAKEVVERHISVPGVQPKLSMSLIEEVKQKTDNRLTVVGTWVVDTFLNPLHRIIQRCPPTNISLCDWQKHLELMWSRPA